MIIEIVISCSGICEEVSNYHQNALNQDIVSNHSMLVVIMWEEPKQTRNNVSCVYQYVFFQCFSISIYTQRQLSNYTKLAHNTL